MDNNFSMEGALQMDAEFPFVAAIPTPKQSRWSKYLADVAELKAQTDKYGFLIPAALMHTVLDISRQRVHQLLDEGKLFSVRAGAQRYVPEDSLKAYILQQEGKGHHYNLPKSTKDAFTRSVKLATSAFKK